MTMSPKASQSSHSRRAFVSCFGVALCALTLLNCSKKTDAMTSAALPASGAASAAPAADKPFTVGFIYVGSKSDYGYNQAHAEGAKTLAALPGVKIREE